MTRGLGWFVRRRRELAIVLIAPVVALITAPTLIAHAHEQLQRTVYDSAQAYADQLASAYADGRDLVGVLAAATGIDQQTGLPASRALRASERSVVVAHPPALVYDHGVPGYVVVRTGSSQERPSQEPVAGSVTALRYRWVADQPLAEGTADGTAVFTTPGNGPPFDRPVGRKLTWACSESHRVGSGDVAVRGCALLDPRYLSAARWTAWSPAIVVAAGTALLIALVMLALVGPARVGRDLRKLTGTPRGRRTLIVAMGSFVVAGLLAGSHAHRLWRTEVLADAEASVTNEMSQIAADKNLDWHSALMPWTDPRNLVEAGSWPGSAVVTSTGRVLQSSVPTQLTEQLRTVAGAADVQRVRWPRDLSSELSGRTVLAVCSYSIEEPPNEVVRACLFIDPDFATQAAWLAVLRAAAVLAGAAIAIPVLTWLVLRLMLRPVVRLREGLADSLRSDTPTDVAWARRGDELDDLADLLNVSTGRLRESLESQRRFVADAAHELRSPIATLISTLEIAERYPSADDPVWTRDVALRQARRLERLTGDLLVLAQLDAQTPLRHDLVDLNDVARTVCDEAGDRAVSLNLWATGGAFTRGDRAALERAVENLIDNACRHASSQVQVTVGATEDTVWLSVFNDGEQIPDEFREQIFQRFARVGPARSRGDGGAGLGLAIARETARRYGGDIVLSPTAEVGTTFTLSLPIDLEPATP